MKNCTWQEAWVGNRSLSKMVMRSRYKSFVLLLSILPVKKIWHFSSIHYFQATSFIYILKKQTKPLRNTSSMQLMGAQGWGHRRPSLSGTEFPFQLLKSRTGKEVGPHLTHTTVIPHIGKSPFTSSTARNLSQANK